MQKIDVFVDIRWIIAEYCDATCRGYYPRKRLKYKEPLIGLMKGSESGGRA